MKKLKISIEYFRSINQQNYLSIDAAAISTTESADRAHEYLKKLIQIILIHMLNLGTGSVLKFC